MGLGGIHPIQLLIVLALVLLVFGGRGKISAMMSDMAHGVRSFRKGLNEDEEPDMDAKISGGTLDDSLASEASRDLSGVGKPKP